MAVLTNSDRSVLKATYVTIKSDQPAAVPDPTTGRAMEKAVMARTLNLQPGEVNQVRIALDAFPKPPDSPTISPPVWQALEQFEPQTIPILAPKPSILAPLPSDQLAAAARAILASRTQQLNDLMSPPPGGPSPPPPSPPPPTGVVGIPPSPGGSPTPQPVAPGGLTANRPIVGGAGVAARHAQAMATGGGVATRALTSLTIVNPIGVAQSLVASASVAVNAFESSVTATPVGMLHLERVEMQPAGIERGELIATIPLAPSETTTVVQKEWSVTSQEFSSIVTDSLENYSEKGVTEKTDLAEASDSQTKHSEQLGLNASVSGSYGGFVTFSTSASFNTSSSDDESKKASRDHATEVTQKASSRVRKERKVTIQTTSVTGTSETSTRTLTNPSSTETMRIDYFSMMRKWRVRLLQYGLRMTYDLVVPEPGATLRALHAQLAELDAQVASPFTFPMNAADIEPYDAKNDNFYLKLASKYGAALEPPKQQYPAPVIVTAKMVGSKEQDWPEGDFSVNIGDGYTVQSAVLFALLSYSGDFPATGRFMYLGGFGFLVLGGNLQSPAQVPPKVVADGIFEVTFDESTPGPLFNQRGQQRLSYVVGQVLGGTITVTLTLKVADDWLLGWKQSSWQALYNAARDTFYTSQQLVVQERDALKAEIENVDTLTLRREEREEIMKSILRWLLGTKFQFMPQEVQALFLPLNKSLTREKAVTQWLEMMAEYFVNHDASSGMVATDWSAMHLHGEMMKFIMEAVEWENLLYILYPYFWDIPFAWDYVRRFQHPDPTREEFLRAGSARVVLTVRPGWEDAFLAFVEIGEFGKALDETHPYLTISEEMQAYAHTNYPGIPPANPESSLRPLLMPSQRKAWQDIMDITSLLEQYKQTHTDTKGNGIYPNSLADLASLGTVPAADPWGKPYQYVYPGNNGEYDLSSLGKDGKPGGDGEDADITSWANASLIGEWFEYTPSHGTDIAITTAFAEMA